MDWFEKLVGFPERSYEQTRQSLFVDGHNLVSRVNGRSFGIGTFELPSLHDLRKRAGSTSGHEGALAVDVITADVRKLHARSECAGALFQVASQFNCLEMVGPDVTPEKGVGRYEHDHTQGPACAIAAGAATIYRNYFVPVGSEQGQTADRQLDGLADVGQALRQALGLPVTSLWAMRNGYALATPKGLDAISAHLSAADEAHRDELRGHLRFGIHWDVEVTDSLGPQRPHVSQIFCSALPVAY